MGLTYWLLLPVYNLRFTLVCAPFAAMSSFKLLMAEILCCSDVLIWWVLEQCLRLLWSYVVAEMVHDLLKVFQMMMLFAILAMIGWPQHCVLHINTNTFNQSWYSWYTDAFNFLLTCKLMCAARSRMWRRCQSTRWTCCWWTRRTCWAESRGGPGPDISRSRGWGQFSGLLWLKGTDWMLKIRWRELEGVFLFSSVFDACIIHLVTWWQALSVWNWIY